MDESEFIAIDWLTAEEVSDTLKERRDKIAEQKSWDKDFWHSESGTDTRKQLFALLEKQSGLMSDLEAASDESAQAAWLDAALAALTEAPAQVPTAEAQPPAATAQAPDQPAGEEAPEDVTSEPEEAVPAATGAEDVPGGEEQAETYAGGAQGAGPAAEEPAPAAGAEEGPRQPSEAGDWNAAWGMFMRFKDGKYEYALSTVLADGPGTEAPAGTASDTWYADSDEAGKARNAGIELGQHLANLDLPEETLTSLQNTPGVREDIEAEIADLEAELAGLEAEAEEGEGAEESV